MAESRVTWAELQALAVEPMRRPRPSKVERASSRIVTTKNPKAARAQCNRKVSYTSARAARQAATSAANGNGDRRMRPYLCEVCKRYHLASSPRTY